MVESIAATSLLRHLPVYGGFKCKDGPNRRRTFDICCLPSSEFLGRKLVCEIRRMRENHLFAGDIRITFLPATSEERAGDIRSSLPAT
nr:sugar phosphatase YfbT-like [Ipomoea batatas]